MEILNKNRRPLEAAKENSRTGPKRRSKKDLRERPECIKPIKEGEGKGHAADSPPPVSCVGPPHKWGEPPTL